MKIAFAVGSALLIWALVTLVGVFEDEHAEQRALLEHEQRTLSTFARARFVEVVEAARAARQADVERAIGDPLAPFDGEIVVRGDRVRPLWSRTDLAALEPSIKELTLALWTGRAVDRPRDAVLVARLKNLDGLRAATTRSTFETAAARFFLHRERHLLAPKWEISTSLAALAILVNQDLAPVEPAFLREAFYGARGALRKGAIAHLLDDRTRARVPRQDLEAALSLARSLAKDAGVLDPRTDAAVRELRANAPQKRANAAGVFVKADAIRVVTRADDVTLPVDPRALLETVELPRDVSLSILLGDTFAPVPEITVDSAPL